MKFRGACRSPIFSPDDSWLRSSEQPFGSRPLEFFSFPWIGWFPWVFPESQHFGWFSKGIFPRNLTNRYQKLQFLKGVTFSKPSFCVSMLVFGGVTMKHQKPPREYTWQFCQTKSVTLNRLHMGKIPTSYGKSTK